MFDTLGHYKILDRLGAGGIGDVYRARDTRLGRTVAIKVAAPAIAGDPARRAALLSDAHAAAALSHPNIAALYEIGEDQGELFLVFEFAPGETLKRTSAGRPLNSRRAIDLAVQIADALAEAHADGIIDGALAPDTIIVTPKGNAKILDVGLGAWTKNGAARPDAAYMSPEQMAGESIDHRSDVFSLGVILFEILTGRLPFSDAAPSTPAIRAAHSPAPAWTTINGTLPAELGAIVSKALARQPDHRYDSMATMAAELRAVAAILDVRSGTTEPQSASPVALAPRRSIAGPLTLTIIAALLATVVWWQRSAIERAWRHTMGTAPHAIVAVMPLDLTGADASRTFFADGLTEDLITRLAQTPGVSVVGRSALRTYRTRAARDVARELGAAVVLTGSVQPEDHAVKVTLVLSDSGDGGSIWTAEYNRAAKDIVALQAKAVEDIAQALRVPVHPTAATARTSLRQVDRLAYEQYLRGRQAAANGQPDEAVEDYQNAVAADDGLTEAFAGLSLALRARSAPNGRDDAARRERIRTAAERAYDLDPDLAEANVAMALASSSLTQTMRYFRRAIDIDPSNGETYRDIADVTRVVDPELSAAFDRRATELDPQPAPHRSAMAAWQSSLDGQRRLVDAIARDRDIVGSALKGALDRRP